MGKKRKLVDPCGHSSQDRIEECRICVQEAVKKPLSARNRNRFSNGHYFNITARNFIYPLTSSRVLKNVPYAGAKCHAVGIPFTADRRKKHPPTPSKELLRERSQSLNQSQEGKSRELLKSESKGDDDESVSLEEDLGIIPIQQLPLKPLFFEVPQEEEQYLVVRDWIFSQIESAFSAKPFTRGIIIHGLPGTGKTSLALQMVEHSCFGRKSKLEFDAHGNLQEQEMRTGSNAFYHLVPHIVAYHFCQVDNKATCLVADFIHSIAAQLCQAPSLNAYRLLLEENPIYTTALSVESCMMDPSSAFLTGIVDPLIMLRKQGKLPSGYVLLILDSVCEAESHKPDSGDTIASFLCKKSLRIPYWFKFIMTARTVHLELLSLFPFAKISLDNMDEHVMTDLQNYITYRLEKISKLKSSLFRNQYLRFDINQIANLNYHLKHLSSGCFLFLKLTLDLIEHGRLVVKSASFKMLPVSLSEVFTLHCNLRFPTHAAFASALPILSTCLAALNPMNLLEIYHSVNSLRANDNLPWVEFLRIFKNLQGLLIKRLDGTYMFFHSSFRDWLSGRDGWNGKFLCDPRMGHTAIAFRLIRVESPLKISKTLDLAHHLLKANVFKRLSFKNCKTPTKDLQALWLLSSTPCITGALSSFTNVYNSNLVVSRLLLSAGASPDAKTCLFQNAPMVVVSAWEGNMGLLSLLLEYGADINGTNDVGDTALHFTSRKGSLQTASYLIRHGALVSKLNDNQECAMVTAANNHHNEMVSFFVANEWDEETETTISKDGAILQSLVAACSKNNLQVIKFLLPNCTLVKRYDRYSGETLLTAACKYGQIESVKFLLENGINPNLSNQYERTPLMIAARLDDVEIADILISNKADLNLTDKDGISALSWACLRGSVAFCRFIMNFPVDVDQADKLGRTPLNLAVFSGSEEIVQLLIENGATLESADLNGVRPLDRAVQCNHVRLVQALLKRGSKLGANTWTMASGNNQIIVCLLNKLLEDGKYLLNKGKKEDAKHRFEYALRKIPVICLDGDEQSMFDGVKEIFSLELSKC